MFLLDRRVFFAVLTFVLLASWALTELVINLRTLLICSITVVYLLGAERYLIKRKSLRTAKVMFSFSIVLLAGWIAAIIHFSAMSLKTPEIDATLYAWDRALGLDWMALFNWLEERPVLDRILGIAYASLLPQIIAVIIMLSKPGRESDLDEFLKLYVATLLFSSVIGALFPAHAMCRWSGMEAAATQEIMSRAACAFLPVYDGLRNGTLTEIDIAHLDGLVTFPSFHTTAAILLAWAFRRIPMAAPFFVALNLLMIGGTPTFGGHYFVDIIAGGLIAFVAIAASRMLSQQDRSFFNQAAASIAFHKGKLPH